MGNLKKNELIETDQIRGCERQGEGRWGRWVKTTRRWKLPVINKFWDVTYNMMTVVNTRLFI